MERKNTKTLSLDKCPHGMFAIALNDEDKKIGTRKPSGKGLKFE